MFYEGTVYFTSRPGKDPKVHKVVRVDPTLVKKGRAGLVGARFEGSAGGRDGPRGCAAGRSGRGLIPRRLLERRDVARVVHVDRLGPAIGTQPATRPACGEGGREAVSSPSGSGGTPRGRLPARGDAGEA